MKTNNLKKILSIVIVSIVLALVAVTIVLAVVPKALYNPLDKNFQNMTIYRNGEEDFYIKDFSEKDKKAFADIMELHEKSLKDSVLSNMLQGTGKFKDVDIVPKGQPDVKENVVDVDGVYAIEFVYPETKTLKINGEDQLEENTFSPKAITYDKMYLIVTDNEKYEKTTIYLANEEDDSSYQLVFLSHQSELYDYITNLKMAVVSK